MTLGLKSSTRTPLCVVPLEYADELEVALNPSEIALAVSNHLHIQFWPSGTSTYVAPHVCTRTADSAAPTLPPPISRSSRRAPPRVHRARLPGTAQGSTRAARATSSSATARSAGRRLTRSARAPWGARACAARAFKWGGEGGAVFRRRDLSIADSSGRGKCGRGISSTKKAAVAFACLATYAVGRERGGRAGGCGREEGRGKAELKSERVQTDIYAYVVRCVGVGAVRFGLVCVVSVCGSFPGSKR